MNKLKKLAELKIIVGTQLTYNLFYTKKKNHKNTKQNNMPNNNNW